MAFYEELMDDVVKASYQERLALGKKTLEDMISVCIKNDISRDDATKIISGLMSLYLSMMDTDVRYSIEFINNMTGINYSEESINEMKENGKDEKLFELLKDILDCFPSDEKTPFCLFGLALMACDGKLNDSEKELFVKLSI